MPKVRVGVDWAFVNAAVAALLAFDPGRMVWK